MTTGRILAMTRNQRGIVQVGMMHDGLQYKRSVTALVARVWLPRIEGPSHAAFNKFDTPIQLDGNRDNNHVSNLMWRPRWFAHAYHQQFRQRYVNRLECEIVESKTQARFVNSFECAIAYGLLEKDLVLSTLNQTFVWPTFQTFFLAD